MSDSLTYDLLLRFDLEDSESELQVLDQTGSSAPVNYPLPTTDAPFFLKVDRRSNDSEDLAVTVLPSQKEMAFDPSRTTGAKILTVDAYITDKVLEDEDDTNYILEITNTSQFYVVEDLQISLKLNEDALEQALQGYGLTTPSGHLYIEISPSSQSIRCLDPGQVIQVPFVAFTRGMKSGKYPVDIHFHYRVLYWDGREVDLATTLALPVEHPFSADCGYRAPVKPLSAQKNSERS